MKYGGGGNYFTHYLICKLYLIDQINVQILLIDLINVQIMLERSN